MCGTEAAEFPHIWPGALAGRGSCRPGPAPRPRRRRLPPARGLQAAFRQAPIHQEDRQALLTGCHEAIWTPHSLFAGPEGPPFILPPKRPEHRSLWACPCHSASSQMGQNPSTLPSQTTHLSSQWRPWSQHASQSE